MRIELEKQRQGNRTMPNIHCNYQELVVLSCHQMTDEMIWWASDYLGGQCCETV